MLGDMQRLAQSFCAETEEDRYYSLNNFQNEVLNDAGRNNLLLHRL